MPNISPNTDNRVLCEFYCQECRGYIYVYLNIGLEGNHIVNCPKCGHKHYRVVKKGKITEERFNEKMNTADEIICMLSAYQKEKRKLGTIAQIRQLEAIGEHQ